MKDSVLVLAEVTDGKMMAPSFSETLRAGQQIAQANESTIHALVLGHNVNKTVEEMLHYGVDAVYVADDPRLDVYHPDYYLAAFRTACKEIRPTTILMGHTLQAIDCAPRLAFDLDAVLVTDCTGLKIDAGEILYLKPVFSSHILAGYAADPPVIITIRSKSFEAAVRGESRQGKVVPIPLQLDQVTIRTPVTSRVVHEREGIKIEDAEVIVAGGRGIGSAEGFEKLAELAHTIGAAVGASRPPIDMGWVSADAQIGQTGTIVAPNVYFAIGISGAMQHLAGMSRSKKIIAINKDKEASIFKVADYGAVGTYEEIVPALTQAFREHVKA